jgi:hypothetical protein
MIKGDDQGVNQGRGRGRLTMLLLVGAVVSMDWIYFGLDMDYPDKWITGHHK